MQYKYAESFRRDYRKLPEDIKAKASKALKLFAENSRHPSLKTHKIKGTKNPTVFEGYIDAGYRFTFHYEEDAVVYRRIGLHKIIDEEARQ